MGREACILGFILVAGALTGCMGGPVAEGVMEAQDEAISPLGDLGLSGENCREGGGHSVHPKSLWERGWVRVVPDPWVPADVLADVGPQLVWSEVPDPFAPVPQEGNTMGNYHATVVCEGWTFRGEAKPGLLFGFVGMKVEPPAFAPDDATHNYVVTVVGTNDEDVHAALQAGGIHAMRITGGMEDLEGGLLRVRMPTDHNGAYDSLFKPKRLGDLHATHVRLWFQHENANGTYAPVALDLLTGGGSHFGAEQQGYFSHSGTHHHAPLPGAYGHTAALYYEDFDRTFHWGPRPDVTLPEAYDH